MLRAASASARAKRAHERARFGVAADVGEGVAHEVARAGRAARGQPQPEVGPEQQPRAVRERAAEARDRAGPRRDPPAAAQLLVRGAPVQPVGQQDQARRRDLAARDRVQQDLGAEPVPADQRPRAEHLVAEARRARRRTSPACRGGAGAPRSRRAAAGRAARRGSGRRGPRRSARTPCGRASPSAAARAAGRSPPRGRRRARRRGGGRAAASRAAIVVCPRVARARIYDREIVALALPALGALAAEPLYLLADTAIVGHLGTTQLAALALAATALGRRDDGLQLPRLRHDGAGRARPRRRRRRARPRARRPGGLARAGARLRARRSRRWRSPGRRSRCSRGHGHVAELAARYLRISAAGPAGGPARDRRPGLPARDLAAAAPARDRDRRQRRQPDPRAGARLRPASSALDGSALGTVIAQLGDGRGVRRGRLAAAAPAAAADARARARRRRDRDPHERALSVVRRGERRARADRQGVARRPPGRLPALQPAGARARRARDRRPGAGRADARRGRRRRAPTPRRGAWSMLSLVGGCATGLVLAGALRRRCRTSSPATRA